MVCDTRKDRQPHCCRTIIGGFSAFVRLNRVARHVISREGQK
jgi:hypothetical protein